MRSKVAMFLLITLSLGLVIGNAEGTKRWTRAFPASGRSAVHIQVVVARVQVVASKGDQIRMEAVGDAADPEPRVKLTRSRVAITWKPRQGDHRDESRSMTVHVPRRIAVRVKTVSGEVEVQRLAAPLRVDVVSGDVKALWCEGPIKVGSVSGAVRVHQASGRRIEVKTVSGAVKVQVAKPSRLSLRTVSGEIDVSSTRAREVRLRSYSGNISVDARVAPAGKMKARTLSGDVNVRWPSDSGFELEARTMSGDLAVGFPLAGAQRSPREASGTFGKGGTKISIRTLSGGLRIRPR